MSLSKEIEKLAKKAIDGPFEAVQPCNTWFVVGKDRLKLAYCYSEDDARLITILADNIPTIIESLRLTEQLKKTTPTLSLVKPNKCRFWRHEWIRDFTWEDNWRERSLTNVRAYTCKKCNRIKRISVNDSL